jgi:hypothetical protein
MVLAVRPSWIERAEEDLTDRFNLRAVSADRRHPFIM